MPIEMPLTTLLSQALIAFTIEFDNEWEKRLVDGRELKILRTSRVMWANFMRFVTEEGITVRDLSLRAGYPEGQAHPSLAGMIRWRYISVTPPEQASGAKQAKLNSVIRPTEEGTYAVAIWETLTEEIEQRWVTRFGQAEVEQLCHALRELIQQFDSPLPHYFPILYPKNGMRAAVPYQPESDLPEVLSLPASLSQVLHAFTLDFEQHSEISLALRANVLRVLNASGIPVRDLPRLSGISKEALAMSINFLEKNGYLDVLPDPNGRGKFVRLTAQGMQAQADYPRLLKAGETRWAEKYGEAAIGDLRLRLEAVVLGANGAPSPLFLGLEPHPSVWRAEIPKPDVIPHHIMGLHRGGWPDGS